MFTSKDFVPGQSFDMKDVLISVNKKQNPFTTLLLSKEVKASSPHVQWIEEEIADSAVTMPEGGDAPSYVADDLTPMENWLELFGATAEVTNTAQYSNAKGISDLLAHEVNKKTKAIKRRVENKLINGSGGGYNSSTKTYTTNGILSQIHSDNQITDTALSVDNFEATLEALYNAGVSDNMICFLPAKLKKQVVGFDSVEHFARENFLGFDLDTYVTVFGTTGFVLCENLTDELFVVNPDYLEKPALIPFHATVQSVSGSKQSVYLETQTGVKLLNAHAASSFKIDAGTGA